MDKNTDSLWYRTEDDPAGKKIAEFLRFIRFTNDTTMDVESFIRSEYGAELGRRLLNRCRLENDPQAEEAYCRSIGVSVRVHCPENYYARWKIFLPEDYGKHVPLPVLFWNHGGGNSIESEEFMTGHLELISEKRFIFVMAQNTNADNILQILDQIEKDYPVDKGRSCGVWR